MAGGVHTFWKTEMKKKQRIILKAKTTCMNATFNKNIITQTYQCQCLQYVRTVKLILHRVLHIAHFDN